MILDANVWVQQLGLHSASGAALIHWLRASKGKIGLPEIVEMEMKEALIQKGIRDAHEANRSLGTIQRLTGSRPVFNPPTREDLERHLDEWLAQLDPILVRIPLTVDLTRRAARMVVEKTPPNAGSEQFRDSIIWLSALRMATECPVVLVSEDRHFRAGKEHDLASELANQISEVNAELRYFSSLQDGLTYLQASIVPQLDINSIEAQLESIVRPRVALDAERHDFRLQGSETPDLQFYATEQSTKLAVTFAIRFQMADTQENITPAFSAQPSLSATSTRTLALATATGSSIYNYDSETIEDLDLDEIEFTWNDPVLGGETRRSLFVRGTEYIGGRGGLPLSIRELLNF